jgi:hypothetical protein
MTQEDIQLLLVDLSSRLPYGVIVRHADSLIDSDGNDTGQFWYKRGYLYDVCKLDDMTTTIIESEGSDEEGYEHICFLERTLPYLRPMSSMTEEEKDEYSSFALREHDGYLNDGMPDYTGKHYVYTDNVNIFTDWLNAHHFDYRGLIEKGLAIEVTEENNPYKD